MRAWSTSSRRRSFAPASLVDGRAYAGERTASADVRETRVDLLVCRVRNLRQEASDGHDHARLAVAALRHLVRDPGLLHSVERAVLRQPFDRRHALAVGGGDG